MDLKAIATGYYLEALTTDGDVVWFSDVVPGGVQRRLPDGTVKEWLPGKRMIGSLVVNGDGSILNSGAGGIAWLDPTTGASGMLLDTIDGKPIGGVNEIVHDGKGGLYFGTIDTPSILRGEKPGPSALYRLSADGHVTQLAKELKFSNGIGISADGRRLYHNETFVGTFVYDVAADGSVGAPKLFNAQTDCDGLLVDRDDNIWVAGCRSSALTCFRPDGTVARRVEFPAGGITNMRFGGGDNRDLYVTTVADGAALTLAKGGTLERTSTLYRVRWDVDGPPIARPRFRPVN